MSLTEIDFCNWTIFKGPNGCSFCAQVCVVEIVPAKLSCMRYTFDLRNLPDEREPSEGTSAKTRSVNVKFDENLPQD